MKWVKQGHIYAPSGVHGWDVEYAHLPTADLHGDRLRVYFAALDQERYGRIGYVDLDPSNPASVRNVAAEPVLDLGEPGTFDDSGVNPSCIVEREGTQYLYYIGWQRAQRVPYMLYAGVAVSDDGGTHFRRLQRTPVLDRTPDEPFLRSAVTIVADNGKLRCWYVSAIGWTSIGETPYPEYVIRYAESSDGLHWRAYQHTCIPIVGDEFGIGRPWVVRDGDVYRMWYSIRSRTAPYRLGYAESRDGIAWERQDTGLPERSTDGGWDSEMICYPCVVDVRGTRYMFYNGNRHGASGFGYAVLEPAEQDAH